MNWHFCPHCETQLDEETFICPACRWDPLAVAPEAEPDSKLSLMERYRGTEYDTASAGGAMALSARNQATIGRTRTIVVVGLVGLLGLYGTMMMYTDFKGHQDRPASIAGAKP
jgi:hypothetical protein